MEIKTKHNVNDELWFIDPISRKAVKRKVIAVGFMQHSERELVRESLTTNSERTLPQPQHTGNYIPTTQDIVYHMDNIVGQAVILREAMVFETREELINNL